MKTSALKDRGRPCRRGRGGTGPPAPWSGWTRPPPSTGGSGRWPGGRSAPGPSPTAWGCCGCGPPRNRSRWPSAPSTPSPRRWATVDEHGNRLSMDQRRTDALLDLIARARGGADGPDAGSGRATSGRRGGGLGVSVVLAADTLFGDGPAAHDPGTLTGLGPPAALDPRTAGDLARRELADGTGIRVLVTGRGGRLLRVLHVPAAAAADSRESLTAAAQQA